MYTTEHVEYGDLEDFKQMCAEHNRILDLIGVRFPDEPKKPTRGRRPEAEPVWLPTEDDKEPPF